MPTKALSRSQRQPRRYDAQRDYHRNHPDARKGSSRAWRKLRLWFLRENPLCIFCGRGATEVDHITPISAGGAELDMDNLRAVCSECHKDITANYKQSGINDLPARRRGEGGQNVCVPVIGHRTPSLPCNSAKLDIGVEFKGTGNVW